MRRLKLSIYFVLLLVTSACQNVTQTNQETEVQNMDTIHLYIGTYTDGNPEQQEISKGIYLYEFDTTTGQLSLKNYTSNIINPSYLVIHPNQQYLYAVSEQVGAGDRHIGTVSSYRIDSSSKELLYLNAQSAEGDAPCHLSIDPSGKYILVANYVGGNVSALPIKADGSLAPASASVQHEGSGTHPRQKAPHAHYIDFAPNGKYAFAVDLGLDQVLAYQLKDGQLLAAAKPFYETVAEGGPRHLIFAEDSKTVYILNELNSTIEVATVTANEATPIQIVSTLPEGYEGEGNCAAIKIHPNGKYLYASNRRDHHSIAFFEIDETTGKLTAIGHQSTQGEAPRDFEIDPSGRYLLAANQDSGTIVVFRIDPSSGKLTPTGETVKVPKPVCLKFL